MEDNTYEHQLSEEDLVDAAQQVRTVMDYYGDWVERKLLRQHPLDDIVETLARIAVQVSRYRHHGFEQSLSSITNSAIVLCAQIVATYYYPPQEDPLVVQEAYEEREDYPTDTLEPPPLLDTP